jgi:hypothetical protein
LYRAGPRWNADGAAKHVSGVRTRLLAFGDERLARRASLGGSEPRHRGKQEVGDR